MWFFVNNFSDDLNNFTLKHFVIIHETFNKQLKFSCFLFINYRGQNIMNIVLKTQLIKLLQLWIIVSERKSFIISTKSKPITYTYSQHISPFPKSIYFVFLYVIICFFQNLCRNISSVIYFFAHFQKILL